MGLSDTLKDAAQATKDKVTRVAGDQADRVSDRLDEARADGEIKKAKADLESKRRERDAVGTKNEYKENLRE